MTKSEKVKTDNSIEGINMTVIFVRVNALTAGKLMENNSKNTGI
jgi:hypothetical protein